MDKTKIRNFAVIAHVDHGKSTLADRLLEMTGTVSLRNMRAQYLDSLDLERERGITIKLKAVRMSYQSHILNLIDTPGHVDFSYEVSRSLAACEGALLVVDSTQGIQAQTLAHIQKALDLNLKIIPVINKIDLDSSDVEATLLDLKNTFGIESASAILVSAKTGQGVQKLLDTIISEIPSPAGLVNSPLRALVFDSYYDEFKGVVAAVRIVDGVLKGGEKIKAVNSKTIFNPVELGVFLPGPSRVNKLATGEVGYIATGLKDLSLIRVGETLTSAVNGSEEPLPGYKEVKPMVFASLYPFDGENYEALKKALAKLRLNDAALSFIPEHSSALGFGFRAGFLGLLHSEITAERLTRDFGIPLIFSLPTVAYEVILTSGQTKLITSPSDWPDQSRILETKEPIAKLSIIVSINYLSVTLDLCKRHRGEILSVKEFSATRILATVDLPLSELIVNFFDELKSATAGFASLDYEVAAYRSAAIVKLSLLVHGEEVIPLARLVERSSVLSVAKNLVVKLKETLPRQQFPVAVQAAVGGQILAREDLPTFRKDVLAKMSGGDQRRKDKLLDLQKRGKKKMRLLGRINISADAYREVLKFN